MIAHTGRANDLSERCEARGGYPLVGDRGHFKGCFATELIPLDD